MAPVIKRIIIFLFSLLIIVLLLAGAAKGEDNLRLRLLNSKEMIKQELPLESGNQVIITESQEYPRRTYLFEPIVIFDDYDEELFPGVVKACNYLSSLNKHKSFELISIQNRRKLAIFCFN